MPLPEVPRIMAKLPQKYRALTAIGVTTGCRISEILSLRRFDVLDREGRFKPEIAFLKLKTRGGTKHRSMAIPERWRKEVVRHLREEERRGWERPDDLIFRGKCGKPLSRVTVYRVFRRVMGCGYGTHWMRKTFAQEMFREFLRERKEDPMRALELTRRALGHARLDTTVKYLGITEASIREAQERVFGK